MADDTYNKLKNKTLSEAQLDRYNFPRPHPSIPGKAVVKLDNRFSNTIPSQDKRKCKRCFKMYLVNADGSPKKKENCFYHLYTLKRQSLYRCCHKGRNARPCQKGNQHVHCDIDPGRLNGFVSTNSKDHGKDMYAFDCEMVHTLAGLDLAAITVVNKDCEVVYETLIQPDLPVIDFNTVYSNLRPSDFLGVTTTLKQAQEKVLDLFGKQTILVGHSLNNDLLKLKLLHDLIVDTSVLYMEPGNMNFRPSLKILQERHFSGIQDTSLKCRKDAIASMKLALLKCK